jgi:ubiquinone/menaquinone biosynthesis C-methylase UbiE
MTIVNDRPNAYAIDALRLEPLDSVLELGFGSGRAIRRMAAKASQGIIYGVDQSEAMVRQASCANRKAIRRGHVLLRLGRFENLPLANETVDKILAVNVVYFWVDPRVVLIEARRVLRPGGIIVIYATDAETMRTWKFAGAETHTLIGRQDLEIMARQSGFETDSVEILERRMPGGISGLIATLRKC